MEYFNCGDHPLQLELERPEGVVGVVIADVAPFRTITARSGVRVQLYIAIGHIGGHCSKEIHTIIILLRSIPYSRKYWRELNLAVKPKITITRILADLNLAVRYGIAIRIICK